MKVYIRFLQLFLLWIFAYTNCHENCTMNCAKFVQQQEFGHFKTDFEAKGSSTFVLLYMKESDIHLLRTIKELHNIGITTILYSKENTENDENKEMGFLKNILYPRIESLYCLTSLKSPKSIQQCFDNFTTKKRWRNVRLNRYGNKNFNGEEMIVAIIPVQSRYVTKFVNNKLVAVDGIEYKLLEELSKKLKFKYRLVIPSDQQFGVQMKSGNWTGLIGMVSRKEANFSLCILTITEERKKVLDFSSPYFVEPFIFVTRTPRKKSKAFIVVRPFTIEVWVMIGFAYIIVGLCMRCVAKIEAIFTDKITQISMKRIFWYLFGLLISQGESQYKTTNTSCLVLSTWLMMVVTLIGSYSGTLVSFITFPGYHSPVDSVEDLAQLVKQGKITVGSLTGTSDYQAFENSNNEAMKIIFQSVKRNIIKDYSESLQKILANDDFAFLASSFGVKHKSISSGSENFHFSEESFYSSQLGIAFPKNYPHVDAFNHVITMLREGGLISKWHEDELLKKEREYNMKKKHIKVEKHLTLDDLQAAFYLLFIGYGIGTITLFLEVIVSKRQRMVLEDCSEIRSAVAPLLVNVNECINHSTYSFSPNQKENRSLILFYKMMIAISVVLLICFSEVGCTLNYTHINDTTDNISESENPMTIPVVTDVRKLEECSYILLYFKREDKGILCTLRTLHNNSIPTILYSEETFKNDSYIKIPEPMLDHILSKKRVTFCCLSGSNSTNNVEMCLQKATLKKLKAVFHGRDRKINFDRKEMTVAAKPISSMYRLRNQNDTLIALGGVELSMLNELSKKLNFRYHIKFSHGHKIRKKRYSDFWTTNIGMLNNEEVDFGVNYLYTSKDTEKMVDFSVPYLFDQVSFVTKAPTENSKAFIFMRLFAVKVWAVLSFACIILWLFRNYLKNMEKTFYYSSRPLGFGKKFWILFGLLVSQGEDTYKPNKVSNILLSSWLLTAITLVGSYFGTVISFICFPGYCPAIDTVEELAKAVEQGKMKVTTMPESPYYSILQNSKIDVVKTIANSIEEKEHRFDNGNFLDTFQHIMKDNVALLASNERIRHLGSDTVHVAKEEFYNIPIRLAFPKYSPYVGAFNKVIYRLTEAGLINKWLEDEMYKQASEIRNNKGYLEVDTHLTLKDLQAPFYMLFAGCGIGIITYIVEVIISKWKTTVSNREILKVIFNGKQSDSYIKYIEQVLRKH